LSAASEYLPQAEEKQPHDVEAEAGALACILSAENGDAPQMLAQLWPDSFYDLRHKTVYRALCGLHQHGKSLDMVSLYQASRDSGMVDDCGGIEYLNSLPDKTPSPANFPTFLGTVQDRAQRRAMVRDAGEWSRLAIDMTIPADTLANACRRMLDTHSRNGSANGSRLTGRRPDELLAMTFDESDRILGDRLLATGQSLVVAGAGGLGKSRILLQLAVSAITGRTFVGFETRGPDLHWLILQAENSNRRLQADFAALHEWTGPKVWPRVNEQLLIHTLETDADGFMSLDNPAAQRRIADFIADAKPDVVCFDSLYNFAIGDLNKDEDMGATLLTMTRLARAGDPDRAIVLLHHALTGRAGAARANGYDRSSFGRNSKVLHSWTRGQLNIAPGTSESNDTLVLSCGKCANGKEFLPLAVHLNLATMIYEVDPDFDLGAWQADIGGQKDTPIVTVELVQRACKGVMLKRQLVKAVMDETGCGKSLAYRTIDRAKHVKRLQFNEADETYVAR
jgi:hypothetical protein